MNSKTKKEKIARLTEIRSELFDLANEFAIAKEGCVAGELHESCNCILRANQMIENGETPEDSDRQVAAWCAKQPFPMNPLMVAQMQELARQEK
jgi:hypothetical protein